MVAMVSLEKQQSTFRNRKLVSWSDIRLVTYKINTIITAGALVTSWHGVVTSRLDVHSLDLVWGTEV